MIPLERKELLLKHQNWTVHVLNGAVIGSGSLIFRIQMTDFRRSVPEDIPDMLSGTLEVTIKEPLAVTAVERIVGSHAFQFPQDVLNQMENGLGISGR